MYDCTAFILYLDLIYYTGFTNLVTRGLFSHQPLHKNLKKNSIVKSMAVEVFKIMLNNIYRIY